MKFCAVIPCYNHGGSLGKVLSGLPAGLPAIVVDDGSDTAVEAPGAGLVRFKKNRGKAEALRAGFAKAAELGFTHAITLDADGQHAPERAEDFMRLARGRPGAIIAGVRDFSRPEIPERRRFMNRFSNFWFRFETKIELADTQCGYRAYPLELVGRLRLGCSRYAYEAEILVKAAWAGAEIIPLEVPTIYTEESTRNSRYRPFRDTALISLMNTRLSFMAAFFPKSLRRRLAARGKNA